MMSLPVWLPGPMLLLRRFSVPGPMFLPGWRVFVQGSLCPGGSLSRGVSVGRSLPPIRKMGGMHPTGMLSCYDQFSYENVHNYFKISKEYFFTFSFCWYKIFLFAMP